MKTTIEQALKQAGIHDPVKKKKQISGGSISEAFLIEAGSRSLVVKWHEEAPVDFFRQEMLGLQFLEEAGALPVPEVYAWDKKFIVMEAVNGQSSPHSEEELGRGIATLHAYKGTIFGLEEDNFIGELPQVNGWEEYWLPFLRDKRLQPQMEAARSLGLLTGKRAQRARHVLDHLDEWVPDHKQPARLHGDLWSGNWLPGKNGHPYLIDPAVWYGDTEFELAFMHLFGGFSDTVYAAYHEYHRLDPSFEERKPLYQLYYLLVHLNIFGESYGGAVDRILKKYAKH